LSIDEGIGEHAEDRRRLESGSWVPTLHVQHQRCMDPRANSIHAGKFHRMRVVASRIEAEAAAATTIDGRLCCACAMGLHPSLYIIGRHDHCSHTTWCTSRPCLSMAWLCRPSTMIHAYASPGAPVCFTNPDVT